MKCDNLFDNLKIRDKNMQCWNNVQQQFPSLPNNSCNTTGGMPWTPIVQPTAFLNPSSNEDKKILYVGNSLQENPQNYTIVYSNSDSQSF